MLSFSQASLDLVVPIGHVSNIVTSAVLPNEKLIATVGSENQMIIWELESGKILKTFTTDTSDSRRPDVIRYSRDSKLIGTTNIARGASSILSTDRITFRVWNLQTGKDLLWKRGGLIALENNKIIYYQYVNSILTLHEQVADKEKLLLTLPTTASLAWEYFDQKMHLILQDKQGRYLYYNALMTAPKVIMQGVPPDRYDQSDLDLFAPALKLAVIAESGGQIHTYHTTTGVLSRLKGDYMIMGDVVLSSNKKLVRAVCVDKVRYWDLASGAEISKGVDSLFFAPSEVSVSTNEFEIKEAVKTNSLVNITVTNKVNGKIFSDDFNRHHHYSNSERLVGIKGHDIFVINARNGIVERTFGNLADNHIRQLSFSSDGSKLFVVDNNLNTFDFSASNHWRSAFNASSVAVVANQSNILVAAEKHLVSVDPQRRIIADTVARTSTSAVGLRLSQDGNYVTWKNANLSGTLNIAKRNLWSGIFSLPQSRPATTAMLTSDGQLLALNADRQKLSETKDGGQFYKDDDFQYYSSDGNLALISERNTNARLFKIAGMNVSPLHVFNKQGVIATTSGKNLLALAFSSGNSIEIYSLSDYTLKNRLIGHKSKIVSMVFSPDEKLLATVGQDNSIKLWSMADGQELCNIRLLSTGDWVVFTANGLFDASAGAMNLLYFVSDLETIDLLQLKDRFYEPNLLKKVVIDGSSAVRDTRFMSKIDLYPDMEVLVDEGNPAIKLRVVNRGGGIGRIPVLINGKEIIEDARSLIGKPLKEIERMASVSITIPISNNKRIQWGSQNYITAKVYNLDGLASRGKLAVYNAPSRDNLIQGYKPTMYAIVSGVSDYENNELDLKYSSKDAADFANALQLSGRRLFGDRVYINLLTSEAADRTNRPTKQNLIKAFEEIAAKATQDDLLLIYLSGHGTNAAGSSNDFLYLTEEASTLSFTDPAIRQRATLSSSEMTDLLKTIAAQKQVIIIDACASGTLVDNLIAKRDVPSGTLKALDRMKDRMGTYILTGCAADAVSYEASRFGQGLLTYSLLSGMRGGALRDNRFIDVMRLFQYSRDEVPKLAENIGGIQEPRIFSPAGAESFDFGIIEAEDRAKISLALPKPLFLRSSYQNESSYRDNLGIGRLMDDRLYSLSSKGTQSPLVFIDVAEFPDGYFLTGRYTLSDANAIRVNTKLFRGETEILTFDLTGNRSDMEEILDQITAKVNEQLKLYR